MPVALTKREKAPLRVYRFGKDNEGAASMKDILGGKGANLAEMVTQGLPVPSGFTIPCEASIRYHKVKDDPAKLEGFASELWTVVGGGLEYLEGVFGFMPLVSVRSGSRVSMPGMMDTILNVGLTTESLPFWIDKLGKRAALDSYRRLIQMYASVAMGVSMSKFEAELVTAKAKAGAKTDSDLSIAALEELVQRYKRIVPDFPDTFDAQLKGAVGAVFQSWMNPRAIEYRQIKGYPNEWGTAANIQAMVFGNFNDKSGSGVAFTRDPDTGQNVLVGDFLTNGQGEDVVAGIRDPDYKVSELIGWNSAVYNELVATCKKLEGMFRDMQEIEFTVQDGKFYMLQTRTAMRSALAHFQCAYDMAKEGLITKEEAVKRVDQKQLIAAMTDAIDPGFKVSPHITGIAAGGGVVSGTPVYTAEDAANFNGPCILVTKETDPDDIKGMAAAVGILTQTGGLTSHAAVVARGWNKTCVVGCTELNLAQMKSKGIHTVTIDGTTGKVWFNTKVPVVSASSSPSLRNLAKWAVGASAVERIEFAPWYTQQQIMSRAAECSGNVYIDTAFVADMEALGSGLLEALTHHGLDKVYIDLSGVNEYLSKSDHVFDSMFGVSQVNDAEGKANKVLKWAAGLLSVVVMREAGGILPTTKQKLVAKGVTFAGKVANFADLLNASGEVEVDDAVLSKVFGNKEALDTAIKMVEQVTGKKLSGGKPDPLYWYDFLNSKAA